METHSVRRDRQQTHVLLYNAGDEVVGGLTAFAREQDVALASFTGVGALEEVTLGFYNVGTGQYDDMPLEGDQFELVSLVGVILSEDGEVRVNAHASVGRPDATTLGGHLLRGVVRPGAMVTVVDLPLQKA